MSATSYHYRQPDYALMNAFNVNEDDIQLNRKGGISPTQKQHIWLDRIPTLVGFASGWFFLAVMFLAFQTESANSPSTHFVGALMALSFLMLIVVIVRAFRIMEGLQVQHVVGIATLERRDGRYGGWFLYVDGRSFELKPSQFETLRDKIPLAVYYVPQRKRLLAVEQIVFDDQ